MRNLNQDEMFEVTGASQTPDRNSPDPHLQWDVNSVPANGVEGVTDDGVFQLTISPSVPDGFSLHSNGHGGFHYGSVVDSDGMPWMQPWYHEEIREDVSTMQERMFWPHVWLSVAGLANPVVGAAAITTYFAIWGYPGMNDGSEAVAGGR